MSPQELEFAANVIRRVFTSTGPQGLPGEDGHGCAL